MKHDVKATQVSTKKSASLYFSFVFLNNHDPLKKEMFSDWKWFSKEVKFFWEGHTGNRIAFYKFSGF